MRGFKKHDGAERFCRKYDELRNFLAANAVASSRHARVAIGIMRSA
jgi:hypothetical protein